MELRHLRCFVAVAEEMHFGRAAERLYVAQSAVSQQVRRLERELGVELLVRNKRRVSLTEAGRVFLGEARRTLEQAEKGAEAAKRASRGQIGRLVVGFIGPATYNIVPEVLGVYRKRFVDVELVLHEWTSAQQTERLREGYLQVGFVRSPVDLEALAVEHTFREPVVVVLPEGHPLAALDAVPVEMLADEPFIFVPRQKEPHSFDRYITLCQQAGFTPRVVQESYHVHILAALVAAGVGVGMAPASVGKLRWDGVVYKRLRSPAAEVETAVVRRQDEDAPVVGAFLEVVREVAARGEDRSADRHPQPVVPPGA
jgi:DNA-binding transcriptional LysR family regulator